MYICLTCLKEFNTEEKMKKHFLPCWKEHNPNHHNGSAPRGLDVETIEVSNDVINFFDSLKEKM